MTINLTWTTRKDSIYGRVYCAKIWQGQTIEIQNNGEKFYNVLIFNRNGYETDSACGAYTVDGAKFQAEEWIKEQLQPIFQEKL